MALRFERKSWVPWPEVAAKMASYAAFLAQAALEYEEIARRYNMSQYVIFSRRRQTTRKIHVQPAGKRQG
jgi:hypothetical protein